MSQVEVVPGAGLRGEVNGHVLFSIGNDRLLSEGGVALPGASQRPQTILDRARTPVLVAGTGSLWR